MSECLYFYNVETKQMEMTLDDAIQYSRTTGCSLIFDSKNDERGKRYLQLAKWLEELKLYRSCYSVPKNNTYNAI